MRNDTEHLLASKRNRERLFRSIKEAGPHFTMSAHSDHVSHNVALSFATVEERNQAFDIIEAFIDGFPHKI